MKKLLFCLCILICGASCQMSHTEWQNLPNFTVGDEVGISRTFYTIQIDSCEYLIYNIGGQTGMMSHKGNCKNPIHK